MIGKLLSGIAEKNRRALSKAITLIESTNEKDKALAEELLSSIPKNTKPTVRIGISGSPGVGKSTFIESFGLYLISLGKKVAVLAIDPSSPLTGGSILGDKTRMLNLSNHPNSFIRPSPSGGNLGGVARKTKDSIFLCEAFSFDVILVETVGVGQSEVAVSDITDIFLLLLQPGTGDELQGIKKGIMELADIVVINKSDGKNKISAENAKSEIVSAISYAQPKNSFWKIPVQLVSSLEKTGLSELWAHIEDYFKKSGKLTFKKRKHQDEKWFWNSIEESLQLKLSEIKNEKKINEIISMIDSKKLSFTEAQKKVFSKLKEIL